MSRRSLALFRLSSIALICGFVACGNKSSQSGGAGGSSSSSGGMGAGATSGSGGNDSATGGAPGAAGGASASGGAGDTRGSGGSGDSASGGASASGSGGADTVWTGVPGAENYDCSPPSGELPVLQASLVVDGMSQPIELAHEPGGAANRLFVLERTGAIKIIEDGALLSAPFLDLGDKVAVGNAPGDERGALGFAFHPNYSENGLFYVHYSDAADPNNNGDSIIEEYKVSSDANVAAPATARLVLKVEQPYENFRNHKGGGIHFGSDGFLYIGIGDGGDGGDPGGHGQKVDILLGKILRIDPVGKAPNEYSIPAGNLKDSMASALPEIWDYGLRNPFRSSFDGCTGNFYIGDVGQSAREEIDVEKALDGGKNYGWNTMEGTQCYSPMSGCDETGITLPVHDYGRGDGQSVTGGAVYRGSSLPALRGTYFFADYGSGAVWSMVYDEATGEVSNHVSWTQDLNLNQVVSIANGADGELYFISLEGGVYRLEAFE